MSSSATAIGAATLERLARANDERRLAGEKQEREITDLIAAHPELRAKDVPWRMRRPVSVRRVQQVMKKIRNAVGVSH